MKKILTLLSLAAACYANAQPVITNAENFQLYTKPKFMNCDPNVKPGDAGPNVTWDFSNLVPQNDTLIEDMVPPSHTSKGALFPTANIVEKYSDGRFVYVNNTGNENFLVGFFDSASGIQIKYPNPIQFLKRPLTYLDSFDDVFTDEFSYMAYKFKGGGTGKLVADGYGKLILPNGTYNNTLRLKFTQSQKDTMVGSGSESESFTQTWFWFDADHRSALLKIDTFNEALNSTKSVSYLMSETVGMKNPAAPLFTIYPNPASGKLTFRSSEKGSLQILNQLGEIVISRAITGFSNDIDVTSIKRGVYIIYFKSTEGIKTEKFIKE